MSKGPLGEELPSWNEGEALRAIESFLFHAVDIAPRDRVAVFDNDGTLWGERPTYTQFEFIRWSADELEKANPSFHAPALLRQLDGVTPPADDVDVDTIIRSFNESYRGLTPREFTEGAHRFINTWEHQRFGRSPARLRYQPMLELLAALRARDFDVFVVTGGGIEFVRSLAWEFYGVSEEKIIGSTIHYHYQDDGKLIRDVDGDGPPNEGAEKVIRIQQMAGREPLLVAGNSAGDKEMLDHLAHASNPTLPLLINHDDAEREYAYQSVAGSFTDDEDIVAVGRKSGWQIVSMKDDWSTIFVP